MQRRVRDWAESGLIPECFGTIRASKVPQGPRRSVGFAWWSNSPLLLARQTVDECREVPFANWIRHQYKKAAMQAYAIAASAGSRGNVGKPCPAGYGESD